MSTEKPKFAEHPPLPEGFTRWEHRGKHWNPGEPRTYAVTDDGWRGWYILKDSIPKASDFEYLEAVR